MRALAAIVMRDELVAYLVDIVRAHAPARQHAGGRRSARHAIAASWPRAPGPALAGRDFVTPDDIKAMAAPVLEHRLILRPEFEIEGLTVAEVIQQILQEIAVPRR